MKDIRLYINEQMSFLDALRVSFDKPMKKSEYQAEFTSRTNGWDSYPLKIQKLFDAEMPKIEKLLAKPGRVYGRVHYDNLYEFQAYMEDLYDKLEVKHNVPDRYGPTAWDIKSVHLPANAAYEYDEVNVNGFLDGTMYTRLTITNDDIQVKFEMLVSYAADDTNPNAFKVALIRNGREVNKELTIERDKAIIELQNFIKKL